MAESGNTRTTAAKAQTSSRMRARQESQRPAAAGPSENILDLQRTAGNRALSELLTHAAQESSQRLDESVRGPMEHALDADLGGVRVHTGASSHAAAESIGARAYTIGSDIYLGSDAQHLGPQQRNQLLAHEAVHTVQQGGQPVALQGELPVSSPGDSAEIEARQIAETMMRKNAAPTSSPALALRHSLRTTPITPIIQRDIKGTKKFNTGEFKIDFTKIEGAAPGDMAKESGTITFSPSATAPESDEIRFVQIVRTTDKSTGTEKEFTWTGGEAPRNLQRTARDNPKNIAPGFYVDQSAATHTPRTKKADPDVLPYYDAQFPNPGNAIGKRRGTTIADAVLFDTPGGPPPGRFLFVTSAKAADTGTWYGTVLWGFELFLDAKGVQKIKGEYHSFRGWRGETTDAALKKFNEFYKNRGASTAPTK